ncbi:MAG: hypothetical protein KY476_04845 [Planctomycetes bacterium]|nr:hypothetical protein [Planctomycetota bacterium]
MSIEQAERLKKELTDKYVVVTRGVPELRRFEGRTGTVKTVNMNGRALVEFDGGEDIGWYDIDPSFLKVVDKPLEKKAAPAKPAAAEAPAAAARPPAAPKKTGGKSPLELARQQAAGASAAAAPAAKPAGKKLSPLEQARQQGAAGMGGTGKPSGAPEKEKPPRTQLSPLELARQQAAAGSAETTASRPADRAAASPPEAEPPPAVPPATDPAAPKAPTTGGQKLSPLELARRQGAAKRDDS